ncbi:hypothetical protein DMENIID0001_008010 [Sergentomyia squamirostris]
MEFNFVKSKRGKDLLAYEGFTYRQEKEINGKRIWKCTKYEKEKCKARAHSTEDSVVVISPHSHVPDNGDIRKKEITNEVREVAKSTREPPNRIVAQVIKKYVRTEDEEGSVPKISNLKKIAQRMRQRNQVLAENPTSVADFEIPAEFQTTDTGETLLLHDSGSGRGDQRTLISGMARNLEYLAENRHWITQ